MYIKYLVSTLLLLASNYVLAEDKWLTYTNGEYCYSIEYPDWKLWDQDSHGFSIYMPGTIPPASHSDVAQGGYILLYGLKASLEESLKQTLANLERNNKEPRTLTNFPLKLTKPRFISTNEYIIGGSGSEGELFFNRTIADAQNTHIVTLVTFVYKDHAKKNYEMIEDDVSRMFRSIHVGC